MMPAVILKFILARVRRGIALRERSKSGIVLCNHFMRHELRRVARRLVSDGVLPEEDLLFFLLPFEVLRLIDTRSPKLVMKATRRRKRALKVANDIYPEHCAGLPLVPVNKVMDPLVVSSDRAVCVKGTPVSHGRVCGPCRVVLSLDDANQIQAGDILITYATDIGWSPYFPMLAGIVTELGGLISHGAVVAREFGLPCIVGAHGASGLFVSGQQVLLDAEKGEICAVEDDH